ncbi:hypothetical protein BD770DRAFT_403400 [Pilaira anomala]|nr:hypothetical protein BD770DRAFT_403400 [Pilaira anomala]
MQNIPIELLLVIFRLLKRKNLNQCMQVSKSWYNLVLPLYFEEIPFHASSIRLVKSQLSEGGGGVGVGGIASRTTSQQYFRSGVFTKKLKIQFDSGSFPSDDNNNELDSFRFTGTELIELFSYLPQLTVFDATSSHYFMYYMECLANHKQKGAAGPRLEEISCDMHEGSFLKNLEACYNYRDSITRLKTVYNVFSQHVQNDIRFIQLLSGFKRLTHLDFYNETLGSRLTPFDIQRVCPNLVQFKFFMEDSFFVDEEEKRRSKCIRSQQQQEQQVLIQRLELNIPALTRSYIKYITSFVPYQLESVSIHLQRVDLNHSISQLGKESIMYLASYLSQIKTSRLSFCHPVQPQQQQPQQQQQHVLYEQQQVVESLKMTQFYQVLAKLKGNRDMYCTASFDDFYPNETEIQVKDNNRLYFKYGLDYEDYVYHQHHRQQQVHLPNKKYSIMGPDCIHQLNFTVRLENEDTLCHLLDYVLNHCPYLQKFTLENNNCQIFGSSLVEQPVSTTRSLHDSLKRLKFVGMTLSNRQIELIQRRLPGVEEMICELGDEYYNNFSNPKNVNIELDMTGLKQLRKFYLDIRTMVNTNLYFHHLFIHLKYSDKQDLYFSIQRLAGGDNDYSFKPVSLSFIEEDTRSLSTCMVSIYCHAIQNIILTCNNNNTVIAEIRN